MRTNRNYPDCNVFKHSFNVFVQVGIVITIIIEQI